MNVPKTLSEKMAESAEKLGCTVEKTSGGNEISLRTEESLIFLIGVAFGILVNLHLHKNTKQMNELKQKINEKIKNIIQRMSLRILYKNLANYDGSCFEELNNTLFFAKELANSSSLFASIGRQL